MALDVLYGHPRGPRANLNALAASNSLVPGQIYLLDDEDRIAVANTVSTFTTFAKESELAGGGEGFKTTATGTGASQNITLPQSVVEDDVLVFVNGVYQHPTTDYTIAGTTLTITAGNGLPIVIIKPAGATGPQGPEGSPVWGGVTGTLSDQTDLQGALDDKVTNGGALDASTTVNDTGTITANSAGFRGAPVVDIAGSVTLALTHAGKMISCTGSFTIPANAATVFPVGTVISLYNNSGSSNVININSDTLRMAGTPNTGQRTLAARGQATIWKRSATEWIVSGVGLS